MTAGGSAGTLPARVATAADGGGAVTFVSDPGAPRVPWSVLHEDARTTAASLQARGVAPGDVVALLGTTSRLLVTTLQAVWLVGATVMVLPLPHRLRSLWDLAEQTRERVHAAGAALVVADPPLAAFAESQPGDPPLVLLPDLAAAGDAFDEPAVDPAAIAVLQFTSGATGDPKGVLLPHTSVLANMDAAAAAATLDPGEDVLVSWLPLYHDMGLLGLLTLAMVTGTELVLGSPQDFVAAPDRWLRWMSDFGGTATAGPDFAYALATRAMATAGPLDLSRWRIALNGGEPVDPATVETFLAAGVAHGLRPSAAFPAFGMAEVGVAGTFPEPGRGMVVDVIDGAALERHGMATPTDSGRSGVRRLVRLGRPVPGLDMRVCHPATGAAVGERELGELQLRGSSLMAGYLGPPAATEEAWSDGWLRTGDLAYVVDGELVACGRLADGIVLDDRRLLPQDVERAVAAVGGVRPGNVAAFASDGPEGAGLVVVAEVRPGAGDLREAIVERVRQVVGTAPADVVLVAPGTLPKTSSGKLQRGVCRSHHQERRFEPAS